ncbi:MAG: 1,4-alpha-glucan branching protein GlgB [Christensenellaceae bacterium]|nr:1,4-alpha-glucan branching protein GlgB [Christensenellaceae bacterium]
MNKEAAYLFNTGENIYAYRLLGAHEAEQNGMRGWRFAVFAPHAQAVSVVGDFNGWNTETNPMQPNGRTGIWHCFVPGACEGQLYKFAIRCSDGRMVLKADPFAFRAELRPGTASALHGIPKIEWTDAEYLDRRRRTNPFTRPMNVYEVHAGSWKQGLDFDGLSQELVDYCADMGYTHIELLPVSEFPLDDSWGYQVTGYYAVTARYGQPEQFMRFVNRAHEKGIGVIIDWVPAHFTKDDHGLRLFDGEALFEPADPLRAEMPQWGTMLFDYARGEVRSFLISNALYWLKEFHVDGLRVDAVSCMLYHDFCRSEWRPNIYGGNGNLEAIDFIKQLNIAVHRECPNVLMIAEESSSYPRVTEPVAVGGLGFDFKWNMGFMNDTLFYFEKDCIYRKYHHDKLTFPMVYAFSEKYMLPFSHDEVVHGKFSLIGRMKGSYDQQFEQLRLLYAYQYAHPGKKLNFMGNEFGQFIEWDFKRPLDWFLLDYPQHRAMHEFVRALNKAYLATPALHRENNGWECFRWLSVDDAENGVIAFMRRNGSCRLLAIFNFQPIEKPNYRLITDGIRNSPITASCIFSTHMGREDRIRSKKVRKGERYIEIPLYGYEGAYYILS